jgi:hypothetical protein
MFYFVSIFGQKIIQLVLLLQLTRSLSVADYAAYGYSVLASSIIFGISVGVVLNMLVGEFSIVPTMRAAVVGVFGRLFPFISTYFVISYINHILFTPNGADFVVTAMSSAFVALTSVNMAVLSLLASRGQMVRAGVGFLFSGAIGAAAAALLSSKAQTSLDFAVILVFTVSILSVLITLAIVIMDKKVRDSKVNTSSKKLSFALSWVYLKEVIKLNMSTFLFQLAIFTTLNIVTSRQSAADLAQLAFATQLFNQFGFVGVVLYPLFLRKRASNLISDRAIMLQWTLGISVFAGVAILLILSVLNTLLVNCGEAACSGFSGASPLSVVSGLVIGALIVIRSPVAWIIQLTGRADLDVIAHSLASLLIIGTVLISSSVEVALWSRAFASAVLVLLPIFLLLRLKRPI